MFNVLYTEKVHVGSSVVKRGNKVSVSQDYLENLGRSRYCEIACTGDTHDGFCVYVKEKPDFSIHRHTKNIKHIVISKKCSNRDDDKEKYLDTLSCVHRLAKAINLSYINGENEFNVDNWLVENNYA